MASGLWDSLRRIAETETAWWHSEVMMLLASGMTEAEMLQAQADLGSQMTPLIDQALLAIYHGQQGHAWTRGSSGTSRARSSRAGLYRRLDRPPAMCFLDLTGYTRLAQERATRRPRAWRRGWLAWSGGRPRGRGDAGEVARRRGDVLFPGAGSWPAGRR